MKGGKKRELPLEKRRRRFKNIKNIKRLFSTFPEWYEREVLNQESLLAGNGGNESFMKGAS